MPMMHGHLAQEQHAQFQTASSSREDLGKVPLVGVGFIWLVVKGVIEEGSVYPFPARQGAVFDIAC